MEILSEYFEESCGPVYCQEQNKVMLTHTQNHLGHM